MEKLVIIIVAVVVVIVIALFVLGYRSQAGAAPGLVDGRLQSCPSTPNCVNSEYPSDADHFIEPLAVTADAELMPRLRAAVEKLGGSVVSEAPDYLAATFTSSIFRYVDDFELRVDAASNTVHVRSASRVGRSDLGANRKRVDQVRAALQSGG